MSLLNLPRAILCEKAKAKLRSCLMATSNASAVEQQVSRKTDHKRQLSHILTETSGFGKAIFNCQNSNHVGVTDKTPVSLMYLGREKSSSASFYSCILK